MMQEKNVRELREREYWLIRFQELESLLGTEFLQKDAGSFRPNIFKLKTTSSTWGGPLKWIKEVEKRLPALTAISF